MPGSLRQVIHRQEIIREYPTSPYHGAPMDEEPEYEMLPARQPYPLAQGYDTSSRSAALASKAPTKYPQSAHKAVERVRYQNPRPAPLSGSEPMPRDGLER